MAAEPNNDKQQSLTEQVTEYIQLQLAATKLNVIEHVSLMLSRGFGIMLSAIGLAFALMFVLGAATIWLGNAIDSLPAAMLIAGTVFALLAWAAYSRREKLIANDLVKALARIFFAPRRQSGTGRSTSNRLSHQASTLDLEGSARCTLPLRRQRVHTFRRLA